MGKSGELFMQMREKMQQDLPLGAEYDPNAPWNIVDYGMKECPECDGTGHFDDSDCCNAEIINGICTECKDHCEESECSSCYGTGMIPRTEEDDQIAKEEASLDNFELEHDGT